jgi:hypothetical protein
MINLNKNNRVLVAILTAFFFSMTGLRAAQTLTTTGTVTGDDGIKYGYSYLTNSNVPSGTQPTSWLTNFSPDGDLMTSATLISSVGEFNAGGIHIPLSNVTDGVLPANVTTNNYFATVGGSLGGSQLIYEFSDPVQISAIDFFFGGNIYSAARSNIDSILYSTDNGVTWISIGGLNGTSSGVGNAGAFLGITPTTTGFFGNGALITNLQFNFNSTNPGNNTNYAGLGEIAVYGVMIPEPGTIWMLALGSTFLLGLRGIRRCKARL